MSNINLFMARPMNPLIAGLFQPGTLTHPVTLLTHDGPYYMYAVAKGLLPDDINTTTAGSPPPTIDATMYAVDVSGKSIDVIQELEFLDVLGLAYNPAGTTWYVSPEAAPLYRLFQNPLPTTPTANDRLRVMKPVVDFFQDVLLPGRLWRLWVTRMGLADTIAEAIAIDRQIHDIQEAQADMDGIIFH